MSSIRVALNLPRTIPHALAYAQSIANALKGNPSFPSPRPPLATFEADIAALAASHAETLTRAQGTIAERNARFATLLTDLDALRSYVQTVAHGSAGEAAALVATSGMHVRGLPAHGKHAFEARQARASGTVKLVARAAKTRASYEWQWSSDETVWVDLPPTVRADAQVSELSAAQRYWFRYRTVTKDGVSDWSQIVSLMVA